MDARLLRVDHKAAEPIYRQIIDQVRRLVMGGRILAGQALPSVREIADVHGINPMTVSRAYSQLEAEGLLVRQRGKGMFVAVQSAAGEVDVRWALINQALDVLARDALNNSLGDNSARFDG